jgi:hypothetical protein
MLDTAEYIYIISGDQFHFQVLVACTIVSHADNRLMGLLYLLAKTLEIRWLVVTIIC